MSLLATLAMVMSLVVLPPALAQDDEAPGSRGIADVCPPPDADADGDEFPDIAGNVHADSINCVALYEIAGGFADGTYGPSRTINRAQMSSFIRNMVETGSGTPLAEPAEDLFTDIATSAHRGNINAIANAGIVGGFADDTYRPGLGVNRGPMATFIANAIDYAHNGAVDGSAPPATTSDFFDDDDGTAHEGNINRLAAQGIVAGVGERQYDPSRSVNRAAMGTFIMQGADFLHSVDAWAPTFVLEPGWHPGELSANVPAGGFVAEDVTFTVEEPHDAVSFVVTGDVDGLVSVSIENGDNGDDLASPSVDLGVGSHALLVSLFAPHGDPAGTVYEGALVATDEDGPIGDELPITIEVDEPDPDASESVTLPLPRDLVEVDGSLVAFNQIVIGPDLDVVDADYDGDARAAADAIAERHDAEVIGRAPGPEIFQLLIEPVDTPEDLQARWEEVAADPEVEFAGPRSIDAPLQDNGDDEPLDPVTPDDPRWDSWDQDNPAGNNWHLEMTHVPTAWARETGSSDVTVAIIDSDFDPDHEDLTFTSITGTHFPGTGHGTHVAGTACADGDNGIGISGVSWECDLHGYEVGVPHSATGIDALQAMEYMVQAAEDGARVVNMSFGLNIACAQAGTDWSVSLAETRRNQYSRAVARAMGHGDVLWVAAAGNNSCDADVYMPAGLTANFPTVFMSVAATNMAGDVSNFSNFGPTTTVAAPGGHTPTESIFSTLPDDGYGNMRGTSMAAPHVTGAAALMFAANPDLTAAQARQCLRGSATTAGRQLDDVAFNEINVDWAVDCATEGLVIELPEAVDIVFSVDLTGSMGGVMNTVQEEITDALDRIEEMAPGTDFTFGLTTYEDYPGFYNSSVCPDSTYSATYGAASDEPFRLDEPLTTDIAAMQAAVDGMTLGSGADGPESYGRAIWEHVQPDTAAALGWRPDALHVVVMFGDNVPHDHDLHRGWEGPGLEPPAIQRDTGYDPGRSTDPADLAEEPWSSVGEIECGEGTDIDFYEDALASFQETGTRLLFINNTFSSAIQEAWRFWASMTGGLAEEITPAGGVDHEDGLAGLLVDMLAALE